MGTTALRWRVVWVAAATGVEYVWLGCCVGGVASAHAAGLGFDCVLLNVASCAARVLIVRVPANVDVLMHAGASVVHGAGTRCKTSACECGWLPLTTGNGQGVQM
eukprot:6865863-Prymnesium_polylepis.2